MTIGSARIVDTLVSVGGFDVNMLSYVDYEWPSQRVCFKSFECPLITATRHGSS